MNEAGDSGRNGGLRRWSRATAFGLTAVVILGLWAFLPGLAAITKGPVLLRVEENRAAIMWETNRRGAGEVVFGPVASDAKAFAAKVVSKPERVTWKWGPGLRSSAYIHKVWLKGLNKGTAYRYTVSAAGLKSQAYEFRTASADANNVRFVVYGDSRSNPKVHRQLVERIIDCEPDFVVNTGDLVKHGERYALWGRNFFAPVRGLAESVCVYTVKGNHDEDDNGDLNFQRLLVPPGGSSTYRFAYGPVDYICLDQSDRKKNEKPNEPDLVERLIKAARTSENKWKFVSYHCPSLTLGKSWSTWGYPDILARLSQSHVDFVLSGDIHHYERFRPVAPAHGSDGTYVTYITSAGGGAELYDIDKGVLHAVTAKTHHFCFFKIKGNGLTMDAIDASGRVIDHVQIDKHRGKVDAAYAEKAVPMEVVHLYQDLRKFSRVRWSGSRTVGERFDITCRLRAPRSKGPVQATVVLKSEEGKYWAGPARSVLVPANGEVVEAILEGMPLTPVKLTEHWAKGLREFDPPFTIECRYQSEHGQSNVNLPVLWEPE